jgi:hypothetical protein
MMTIGHFEEEWESLKKDCEYGSLEYDDPSASAAKIIRGHFRNICRQEKYGVYVVRQQVSREVLYIGKGGTIKRDGGFKGQDIPGRLTNVKGNTTANEWFRSLVEEKGPLAVEYVFLTSVPRSPTFVEAVLLQAYLNEHGCLPYRNRAL